MSKIFSHKRVFCSLFCALFFSALVFGQSNNLSNDLKNSFTKFNLVRLNNQAVLRQVESRQSLIVPVAGKNYELNLTPRDLRAANYRAEMTTADGVKTLEREAATTFRGTITGESDSKVRLTIDGTKIEGYFSTSNGEKFYIEPAKNYSRFAGIEDSIIYQEKDLLRTGDFVCESELGKKIKRAEETVNANRFQIMPTYRVLELATEADFSFVTELGGVAQANNEILNILNLVEGNYEAELGLTFDVVFQHAWATPDPFDGSTASLFLNSFRTYWNANYPQSTVPRDAAHLFTSRQNFSGRGLAYQGTICVNPNSAYSFTGRLDVGTIKYVLTAHEIAHNLNATHVDGIQGCQDTIMVTMVNNLTPIDFCQFSRTEITNFVTANGSCLTPRTTNSTRFDFDGDGKADVGVFRPSNGIWYLMRSTLGFTGVQFGLATDKIAPADYDGDGKTDIAVFRAGNWFRLKSSTNTFDGVVFGTTNDLPVPADYDGDGRADIAVFRPADGVWHRLLSANNAYAPVQFGANRDVPVTADYDGDGKSDVNVFRPSNGAWYRLGSSNGAFSAVQFGQDGDMPLAGDFDGDGKADTAVFRQLDGGWYILRSSSNSLSASAFGLSTDIPTPADYDGDGKTDISVFRPSSGSWFRINSSNNSFVGTQFGANGDIPVQAYYIQ